MGCGASKLASSQQPDGHAQVEPMAAAPKEYALEEGYAQHRHVIRGTVKVVALLVGASGLPGAEALKAIMTGVIIAADKATDNRENCKQMVTLVLACDQALGKVTGKSDAVLQDCEQQVHQLKKALSDVRRLVDKFGQGRGMFMRLLMATVDEADFLRCHKALTDAMSGLSLVVSLGLASLPTPQYCEDMDSNLVLAVCKRGGGKDWKQAFLRLQEQGRLTELREFLSDKENLLLQLTKQLTLQELQAQGVARAAKLPALAKYLQELWHSITLDYQLPAGDFLLGLENWMVEKGYTAQLDRLDKELRKAGLMPPGEPGEPLVPLRHSPVFLQHVLLPFVDDNKDNMVTIAEMVQLQLTVGEFASRRHLQEPDGVPELLTAVYAGVDKVLLAERLSALTLPRSEEAQQVLAALQAEDIIRSYKTAELLASYVPGSRDWLYQRVTRWLDAVAPMPELAGAAAAVSPELQLDRQSRMFLLLAGPGMGKSVFSAIVKNKLLVRSSVGKGMVTAQHFFKVGQARAQAKTMVMCLAYQLAERLPGMLALLAPVVDKHGAGASLSLLQCFEMYLLEPLQALDRQQQGALPAVLLLLDALDEADDTGRGWLPVAGLLAKDFGRLLPFVRIVLTSRPEASQDAIASSTEGQPGVADFLKAWQPVEIAPETKENQADVQLVLRYRLKVEGLVEDSDMEAAVTLMQLKSRGQFVWLKFAFEQLSQRQGPWMLAELALVLLDGLYGTYRYLLARLRRALLAGTEEQRHLWALLHERLLPVLLVAREALTVAQLAWLAGARPEDARQAVEMVGSLFPCWARGMDGEDRVLPYHKSVLDWLGSEKDAGEELVANRQQGHSLAAAACHDLAMGLHPWVDAPPVAPVAAADAAKKQYALLHTMAHLVAAGDGPDIDRLALQFGFWQHAYAAGVGPTVFHDLLMYPTDSPVVKDVTRWLRNCSAFLSKYPQAWHWMHPATAG